MHSTGFRVAMTTTGQSSPASIGNGKPYRWHGIKDWVPGDERFREPVSRIPSDPGNQHRMGEKAARMKVFTEAREREEPLSVREAGDLIGVRPKTARGYERERLARQQQGEARDA